MNKKNIKLGILVISLITIVTSVSYAYYQAFFQDTRTDENNGDTTINTNNVANANIISNIPDAIGSFSESAIYPGHKEVAALSVTASGEVNSKSSFQFKYKVEENGLGHNVKVSIYKSETPIET